jgi:hypothetical protein
MAPTYSESLERTVVDDVLGILALVISLGVMIDGWITTHPAIGGLGALGMISIALFLRLNRRVAALIRRQRRTKVEGKKTALDWAART